MKLNEWVSLILERYTYQKTRAKKRNSVNNDLVYVFKVSESHLKGYTAIIKTGRNLDIFLEVDICAFSLNLF